MWLYIPGKVDVKGRNITQITVNEKGRGIEVEYQEGVNEPSKVLLRGKVTIKVGEESKTEEMY